MEITTYGELKKALPTTGSTRVPGSKQLRESANLVLKKNTGTAIIEVYDNGFFILGTCGRRTVFGVDRCDNKDIYKEVAGGNEDLNFDPYPWEIILEAAGSVRLDHSAENDEDYRSLLSLDEPGTENNIRFSVMPEHELREENEEVIEWRRRGPQRMKKAMEKPTLLQSKIAMMYYRDHLTQAEIAKVTGKTQQYVSKSIRRFVEIARKNF